jgi:hypothetical protein
MPHNRPFTRILRLFSLVIVSYVTSSKQGINRRTQFSMHRKLIASHDSGAPRKITATIFSGSA